MAYALTPPALIQIPKRTPLTSSSLLRGFEECPGWCAITDSSTAACATASSPGSGPTTLPVLGSKGLSRLLMNTAEPRKLKRAHYRIAAQFGYLATRLVPTCLKRAVMHHTHLPISHPVKCAGPSHSARASPAPQPRSPHNPQAPSHMLHTFGHWALQRLMRTTARRPAIPPHLPRPSALLQRPAWAQRWPTAGCGAPGRLRSLCTHPARQSVSWRR